MEIEYLRNEIWLRRTDSFLSRLLIPTVLEHGADVVAAPINDPPPAPAHPNLWHIYCKLIPVLTGSHILGRLEQPVVQLHNLSEQVQNLSEQV